MTTAQHMQRQAVHTYVYSNNKP